MSFSSALSGQPSGHAEAFSAAPPATAPSGLSASQAAAVDSHLLLQGQKAVTIVHNGTPYRLQATRLGKLILTK